jgi:hypothetical protein
MNQLLQVQRVEVREITSRDAAFGRSASITFSIQHSYCIEKTIKFVCLAYQLVGYGT